MENNPINSYETGSVKPPKSRSGVMTVLLVAVVLLAATTTALSIVNVQLFARMSVMNDSGASFYSPEDNTRPQNDAYGANASPRLGIYGDTVTRQEQRYYRLPAGVLVTAVDAAGCAGKAGLAEGDIITAMGDTATPDVPALQTVLAGCAPRQEVRITFYRHSLQQYQTVTLRLDPAQ